MSSPNVVVVKDGVRTCRKFPHSFVLDFTNEQQQTTFNMAANGSAGIIQPGIFEDLQKKIDEDSAVKDVGAIHVMRKE